MACLKVRVRPTATTFTVPGNLRDLASALEVVLDPGDEIVHIGESPPADTSKRWQKVDSTGAIVGKMKTYQQGEWL